MNLKPESSVLFRACILLARKIDSKRLLFFVYSNAGPCSKALFLNSLVADASRLEVRDWIVLAAGSIARDPVAILGAAVSRSLGGKVVTDSELVEFGRKVESLEFQWRASERRVVYLMLYFAKMLEGSFRIAFEYWDRLVDSESSERFAGVNAMISRLPESEASVALIMPGPAESHFGTIIDAHHYVARVASTASFLNSSYAVGGRADFFILNKQSAKSLVRAQASDRLDILDHFPHSICVTGKTVDVPREFRHRIFAELEQFSCCGHFTSVDRVLTIVPAVAWSLKNGMKPTIYFNDFYLGNSFYNDVEYDTAGRLREKKKVLITYLRHDIFAVHSLLRYLFKKNLIDAEGRTRQLLSVKTSELAEILEDRWF